MNIFSSVTMPLVWHSSTAPMQNSYFNSHLAFINISAKSKKRVIFIKLSKNSFLSAFWKKIMEIWLLYKDSLSYKKKKKTQQLARWHSGWVRGGITIWITGCIKLGGIVVNSTHPKCLGLSSSSISWALYSDSPSFNFLICKMGITTPLASSGC